MVFTFVILFTNTSIAQYDFGSVDFWVGTGENQAMLVVDFNDGNTQECYAWGFCFNGIKTGENMLNEIAAADTGLTVDVTGGFLNSIVYNGQEGMPGSPDYWMTFTSTSLSNWTMNAGISTELANNDWFGCSYTGVDSLWNPLFMPENPVSATPLGTIDIIKDANFSMFPNPANNFITLILDNLIKPEIIISNIYGQIVFSNTILQTTSSIQLNISNLLSGTYILNINDKGTVYTEKFVKL